MFATEGRVESLDTVTVFLKRDLLDLIALVEFFIVPHQTRGKNPANFIFSFGQPVDLSVFMH